MSVNRIQKLLFSEYSEFEDMVLVESPFAQTTREGKGIRQVSLGLTPSKLVLATDILPLACDASTAFLPGIDPEVETFELVAVYPVECLNLSIFHRRKRQCLKAHFCNNKILYFELGGFEKRQMFWHLWCERVMFLCPEDAGSSHSETSVASSISGSTFYLVSRKRVVKHGSQVWYRYGSSDIPDTAKWLDRYLYLGRDFEESPLNYKPIMMRPSISEFIIPEEERLRMEETLFSPPLVSDSSIMTQRSLTDRAIVNRFGEGVEDRCKSSLYLPGECYLLQQKLSRISSQFEIQSKRRRN